MSGNLSAFCLETLTEVSVYTHGVEYLPLTPVCTVEDEIAEMSVDLTMLDKLKARVQLARQIETSHHKVKKANHERNWMKEAAKALEVELDDDRQVVVPSPC